jgi:hypothetical protein
MSPKSPLSLSPELAVAKVETSRFNPGFPQWGQAGSGDE